MIHLCSMTDQDIDETEDFNPCPVCEGNNVFPYTRWKSEGAKLEKIYSYIQCDDCRTTSHNTTSTFTWQMVVDNWDSKRSERE